MDTISCYVDKLKSASDPVEKAVLFNGFFSSEFTPNTDDLAVMCNDVVHPDLLIAPLKSRPFLLDLSKATGADNIPPTILKGSSRELSDPLSALFNMSFRLGVVSLKWKRAIFTSVFKSDNKNLVENYVSISLFSISSKYQGIIQCDIFSQVDPHLSSWQHGFLKGGSCVSQLVFTHDQCTQALDAVFGVSGCLLNWCRDYLTNHEQRVVIDGAGSDWHTISSGVPQGFHPDPLFFWWYLLMTYQMLSPVGAWLCFTQMKVKLQGLSKVHAIL